MHEYQWQCLWSCHWCWSAVQFSRTHARCYLLCRPLKRLQARTTLCIIQSLMQWAVTPRNDCIWRLDQISSVRHSLGASRRRCCASHRRCCASQTRCCASRGRCSADAAWHQSELVMEHIADHMFSCGYLDASIGSTQQQWGLSTTDNRMWLLGINRTKLLNIGSDQIRYWILLWLTDKIIHRPLVCLWFGRVAGYRLVKQQGVSSENAKQRD